MDKKDMITGAIDGIFGFIATGNRAVDSFVKRLVSFTLLLWIVVASVSSLVTDLYVGTQAVSSVFSVTADEAALLAPDVQAIMDDAVAKANEIVLSAQDAVGMGDEPAAVEDVGTEVPLVPVN